MPEELEELQKNPKNGKFVVSGLKRKGFDLYLFGSPSRHGTYIFNIFVLINFFNILNSRKIKGKFRIFGNIRQKQIFALLTILIIHVLVVSFGHVYIGCAYNFEILDIRGNSIFSVYGKICQGKGGCGKNLDFGVYGDEVEEGKEVLVVEKRWNGGCLKKQLAAMGDDYLMKFGPNWENDGFVERALLLATILFVNAVITEQERANNSGHGHG